jgi:hypothetical protein
VADGDDLGHAFPITIVAFDMADEVADMVADLIVPIVDGKSAQDPVEVGCPITLVAADCSAKGDNSFLTSHPLARPDLNPQAVRDRLALPGRPHSAFVRSITAPDVAPFIEPTGRALVVGARVAILGSSATQALARGAIL